MSSDQVWECPALFCRWSVTMSSDIPHVSASHVPAHSNLSELAVIIDGLVASIIRERAQAVEEACVAHMENFHPIMGRVLLSRARAFFAGHEGWGI